MHLTPRTFHRVFFVALIVLLACEAVALSLRQPGDTISEWVWSKIHTLPLRMVVGGLLVWLLYHLLWSGPGRGLSPKDAVFAALGLVIGAASYAFR